MFSKRILVVLLVSGSFIVSSCNSSNDSIMSSGTNSVSQVPIHDIFISVFDRDEIPVTPEEVLDVPTPEEVLDNKNVQMEAKDLQPVATVVIQEGCEGIDWIIPVHIVWRESRCNFHAINYTGCGGWTCVGAYQFDLRHWIPKEEGGWGGCAWLGDWTIPENQIECARQMSRNGTNLAPWNF